MNNKEVIDYKSLSIELQYDEIGEEYIATCRCKGIGTLVISGCSKEDCIKDIQIELDSLLDI